MPRKPRNVFHLPSVGATASDQYRKLAADLIRDHARPDTTTTDKTMTTQQITGDGNIQLRGSLPISQTITGNNNIQLALDGDMAATVLARLRQLVTAQAGLLKKQTLNETL